MDIKAGGVLVERGREHRRLEVLAFATAKTSEIYFSIPTIVIATGKMAAVGDLFAICSVKLKGRKKAHDITRIRVSRIPKDYRIERK